MNNWMRVKRKCEEEVNGPHLWSESLPYLLQHSGHSGHTHTHTHTHRQQTTHNNTALTAPAPHTLTHHPPNTPPHPPNTHPPPHHHTRHSSREPTAKVSQHLLASKAVI